MRRISKIKIPKTIKSVYSDEEIVTMRESVANDARNLSIFDLLQSSGLRVGELVALNKNDLDLESQSAIVHGKGDKERRIYFDVKTKVSLKKYLDSRPDTNEALFVSKRTYSTKQCKVFLPKIHQLNNHYCEIFASESRRYSGPSNGLSGETPSSFIFWAISKRLSLMSKELWMAKVFVFNPASLMISWNKSASGPVITSESYSLINSKISSFV